MLAYSALRIWAHDRGPVLFSHTRIGKDGREFGCLKFRTMVANAEALVAELRAEAGADALLFKMKDDPRITVPGRWLRRFSLDELPQLVNVLRGDMSLVGPRPQVAAEVAHYEGGMSRRLLVRPGMTGLWQVSGRSDLTLEEAMRLDLFYVDNWSMVQDLAILGRTLGAVARLPRRLLTRPRSSALGSPPHGVVTTRGRCQRWSSRASPPQREVLATRRWSSRRTRSGRRVETPAAGRPSNPTVVEPPDT